MRFSRLVVLAVGCGVATCDVRIETDLAAALGPILAYGESVVPG